MTTRLWRPSGAPSSARPWPRAPVGPRTSFGGNASNISKAFITGAGSTALWGTNHLWTSKTKPVNSEQYQVHRVQKMGGREGCYSQKSFVLDEPCLALFKQSLFPQLVR